MEAGLFSFLSGEQNVTALVGSRIYPLKLPQAATYPAITYQRVSGDRIRSLDGPSGLADPRIQLDLWDKTYSGVKALADTVRGALDGFRGLMGTDNIGGVLLLSDSDFYEQGVEVFRVIQDYSIWHKEN